MGLRTGDVTEPAFVGSSEGRHRAGVRPAYASPRAADGRVPPGPGEPEEYAVVCLRRVSPPLRAFAGIEGSQDEVEMNTEAQWSIRPNIFLKLNKALDVSSRAAGRAPEVGVMGSFE